MNDTTSTGSAARMQRLMEAEYGSEAVQLVVYPDGAEQLVLRGIQRPDLGQVTVYSGGDVETCVNVEPMGHPHHPQGFCTLGTCEYARLMAQGFTTFTVALGQVRKGDWADHKGGNLDPRQVTRTDVTGARIWIDILGLEVGPLPADNYRFTRTVTKD